MYWILFIIFSVFAAYFFSMGYKNSIKTFVQLGSLFMIVLGFLTVANGLYLPNGYNIEIGGVTVDKVIDTNHEVSSVTFDSAVLVPNYDVIDKENVYANWLFGLLLMLVGAFLFFDSFYNVRFKNIF